jgi:hypothetical protein
MATRDVHGHDVEVDSLAQTCDSAADKAVKIIGQDTNGRVGRLVVLPRSPTSRLVSCVLKCPTPRQCSLHLLLLSPPVTR